MTKRNTKSERLAILFAMAAISMLSMTAFAHSPGFTTNFMQDQCTFSSNGSNPYFILEPGYELVLAGVADGENVQVIITVLDETKEVEGVETRVVRERETANGEVVEISRNYFAICNQTNSVFYFGEDVNIYEDGAVVSHDGAWRAGKNGAKAGMIMPGTILLGSKYYQEIAAGVALDRAEHLSMTETVSTPFQTFTGCLKTRETTPLEPGHVSIKFYAPGVGLIKDGEAELISVTMP